jgi:hypothetical protein
MDDVRQALADLQSEQPEWFAEFFGAADPDALVAGAESRDERGDDLAHFTLAPDFIDFATTAPVLTTRFAGDDHVSTGRGYRIPPPPPHIAAEIAAKAAARRGSK